MAAYERYEAKAAAAAEAERIAEEERAAVAAECVAAEAEEDAAEKYEQSATVTVFFGSSKAFSFGFLNESSVPPKINAILPQFDVVLLQFRDLGLGIVFPQIRDLGFAVSPKNGNSVLRDGVLADYGGDSAIDGAGRPPRKPPDVFLPGGDPCCLVRDRYLLILSNRLPAKSPDSFLCGGAFAVVAGGSCLLVMAHRPPAKPPDSAEDGGERKGDDGVKGSILAVTVKGKRPQKSGCLLNPSSIRVGQAQAAQRGNWALLELGEMGLDAWIRKKMGLLFHLFFLLCLFHFNFHVIFQLYFLFFWGMFHSIVASSLVLLFHLV